MGTLTRKLVVSQMIAGVLAGALLSVLLQRQISRLVTGDFLEQGRISARAVAGNLAHEIDAHNSAGLHEELEHGVAATKTD